VAVRGRVGHGDASRQHARVREHRPDLDGHARAAPHGSGRYESFHGWLLATGGTGSYSHARGRAGFYGVLDRKTYNMTVQTIGTLSY
jgi:hypothetical protein